MPTRPLGRHVKLQTCEIIIRAQEQIQQGNSNERVTTTQLRQAESEDARVKQNDR